KDPRLSERGGLCFSRTIKENAPPERGKVRHGVDADAQPAMRAVTLIPAPAGVNRPCAQALAPGGSSRSPAYWPSMRSYVPALSIDRGSLRPARLRPAV